MIDTLKMVALAAGALFLVAGTASAAGSKCQGSKIKDAGKKAACLAGLQAKLATAGTGTLDPAAVAKCDSKVGAAFSKLEGKGGCNTTGDSTTIENKVDAFVDDLKTELNVGGGGKCQGSKIKDAGKKAACLTGLQAKLATAGTGTPDPAAVAKCDSKVGAAFSKLEGKGGCTTTGDSTTIENKVDAFVDDLVTELNVPPTTTTTTTTTTTVSTTTTTMAGPLRIVMTTAPGILAVSGLPAFPFPSNVQTIIEVGAPDGNGKRVGIIPPGGYYAPVFCIPGLMFTSQVTPLGCESGGADGQAVVWDSTSPNADPNISRAGDTSDGTCNPAGQPCTTAAGGAGNNTLGNINTTRGGSPSATGKVETLVDVPVNSLTWQAADFSCPDTDGMFSAGDTPITNFNFILSPTTGSANAVFTDLNGDSCSRAGAGPDSTHHCAANTAKPCGGASDPNTCGTATASCVAGPIHGTPANGPGCVVGQSTTVVSTGIAFSGGAPLFDLIFASSNPATISSCGVPSSSTTCTLTTDPCQD